jgi:hypothetical protein
MLFLEDQHWQSVLAFHSNLSLQTVFGYFVLYLVQFRVLGKLFGLWLFHFFYINGTVLGFDK